MGRTPGPWTTLEARSLIHIETRDSPVGDGVHVCSVPLARAGDAALIAAAPDMLQALTDAVSELDAWLLEFSPTADDIAELRESLREAIAKAEPA